MAEPLSKVGKGGANMILCLPKIPSAFGFNDLRMVAWLPF
jgi:hypothetical protein